MPNSAEEEQLRLQAVKKEQEEQEKQVKLRQAEVEKAKTKKGKLFNPDNYDIGDVRSDFSSEKDSSPKKPIPTWARRVNLNEAYLKQQTETDFIDIAQIFPEDILLQDPINMNDIFKIQRAYFNKRKTSALWKTPTANL
ncbi:inner centromere protein-like [Daphnia pulex]|uniref:inner centromere protein-like n=1 Tax=Daphnia pulex TaxID=6669 RepID=UPI001EDF8CF6|nr:inner centromere protein-like [Daphnia pulex]